MNSFSLFCRRILGFLLLAALLPLAVRADSWAYPSNPVTGTQYNIGYSGDDLPDTHTVKFWVLLPGGVEGNLNEWVVAGTGGGSIPHGTYSTYFPYTFANNGTYLFRVTHGNASSADGGGYVLVPGQYTYRSSSVTVGSPDTAAPSTPGTITTAYLGTGSFSATWGASTDAGGIKHYNVKLRQGSVGGPILVSTTTPSTSYTFSGLGEGVTYWVVVTAQDHADNVSPERSGDRHLYDLAIPTTPGAPTFSAITASSFAASWSPSTHSGGSGLGGYEVRVMTGSVDGPLAVSLITTGAPSCTVTGLNDSTTYYVKIVARSGDNVPSAPSSGTVTTLDGTPPTTPGIPTFTGISQSSAVARWSPSTDNAGGSGMKEYELKLYAGSVNGTLLATRTTPETTWAFTDLVPNTAYAVAVRARDHAGNTSPPSVGNFTTLAGGGSGIAWGTVAAGSDPGTPIATTGVGVLGGGLTVDNKGSANYDIPLKLAPGRGGMEPKISLVYNSQNGNGPVGQGWSVGTGFPRGITRGRDILARDNSVRGINFASTDKFYLDGKRLICVSGTYGQPGSIYRTEVDSFVTVTAGGFGGNIETFTAVDKAGVTMVFGKHGATVDGYQKGAGGSVVLAYTYALKQVTDSVGNAIDFNYTDVTTTTGFRYGEYVLSEILYTSNPGAGIPAKGSVTFHYNFQSVDGSVERRDQSFINISQYAFAQTRHLDGINVSYEGTRIGYYKLGYEYAPANGNLRLNSVQPYLLDPDGTFRNFGPTTIAWSNETVTAAAVVAPANNPSPDGIYRMRQYTFADFNGDGKTDYLSTTTSLNVALSNGSGFKAPETWYTLPQEPNHRAVVTGDFNGDGLQDILYGFGPIYALKSTGSGFTGLNGSTPTVVVADTSSIWADRWDVTPWSSQGFEREGAALASRITVGDFTGDGRDDVLLHGFDGYVYLVKSTGTGFEAPQRSSQKGMGWEAYVEIRWVQNHSWWQFVSLPPEHHTIRPIICDLNGDGRKDYVSVVTIRVQDAASGQNSYVLSRYVEMRVSLPNGDFTEPALFNSQQGYSLGGSTMDWTKVIHAVMPVDVNNDGLTDFMVLGDNAADVEQPLLNHRRWTLYLNRGASNDSTWPTFETVLGAIPNTVTAPGGELLHAYYTPFTGIYDSALLNPTNTYGDATFDERRARVESASGTGMFFTDMNGDGYADLLWYAASKPNFSGLGTMEAPSAGTKGWWVLYSNRGKPDANGSFFSNPQRLTVNGRSPASIWETATLTPTPGSSQFDFGGKTISNSVDLNGDGRQDWLCYDMWYGENMSLDGIALGQGTPGSLVSNVTNGLGSATTIAYKAAKDDTVYTDGATVGYPIQNLRASTPVVSRVEKDSGTAGANAVFLYQYSGNRLDLSGRGSLGFHSFVTLDQQTGLFKYQFLAQSFPMTGLTHREETYRWWNTGSQDKFRFISSHDNTVVFDKVSTAGGATLWPFISKAIEYRWEDSATEHFSFAQALANSQPENLFNQAKPTGAHITISAQSLFDNQSAVQLTLPGVSGYNPSDFNGSANTVAGTTTFATFSGLPGNITYGNLKQLATDYGSGFTEAVTTAYKSPVGALTGLVDNVTTTVTSPGYGTETAPVKRYNYWGSTPLVADETIDATDNALDLKTTYTRDARGRVTNTQVTNTVAGGLQAIGDYSISSATAFDDHWDQPTTTRNAAPYQHTTTTVYHGFLGQPTSVTDVNNAQFTTTYDALGRVNTVTDVLKSLTTTNTYALDTTQTVSPPAGVTGVSLTSAYKVTTTATVKPTVTTYYDRLGRPIRTIKDGFNSQQVLTDTAYNVLGQAVAVSNPYPSGGTAYWTKTTYDALGRVATVTTPNGTVTTNTYIGRATKVSVDAANLGGVDPAAQFNTTLVDAKGRTVKVWNADNVPNFSDPVGTTSTTASIAFALDGFGRMRATTLLGQAQAITATYDALGRQLTLNDPDKGNWTYVNNALGQVVSQTDAKANATSSTFDRLGRPLARTTVGGGVTETAGFYYYDTDGAKPNTVAKGAKGWIGAPEREEANATGSFPTVNLHYYDEKGRPSLELAKSDGKWFYTATSYDAYSRPAGVRHYWKTAGDGSAPVQPYVWEDFGYVYGYDAKSYLLTLTDSLGRDWWSAPAYDFLDRVTSVKKGNGYTTTRAYRPEDGVLTAIATGALQNMGLGFDGLGNLRSRTDAAVSGGTESFGYDNLNRLTGAGNTGTIGYLANGNIQTKSDVLGTASGTYTYDSVHPHAVAGAFGFAMTYDANGNLLTRAKAGDQSGVTWTGFDKPRTMWRVTPAAVAGSEFHYNANRSRVMQLEFDGVSGTFPAQAPSHYNRKRVYALGSTLELNYNNALTSGTGTNWKLDTVRIYVPGPDGVIGAREFKLAPVTGATSEKTLVYHYDHLGSITAISDWGATSGYSVATGSKAGRYSEDAWGQRRDPLDWVGAVPATADDGGFDSLTPRGFTGHEMLDDLGLVHMNGRIYDPLLGRFLSADLQVQFPDSLQSYNRYSYVRNNPLTAIDLTGWGEYYPKGKAADEGFQRQQDAVGAVWTGTSHAFIDVAQLIKKAILDGTSSGKIAQMISPELRQFSKEMDKQADALRTNVETTVVEVTGADNKTSYTYQGTRIAANVLTPIGPAAELKGASAAGEVVTQEAKSLARAGTNEAHVTAAAPDTGLASEVPKDAPLQHQPEQQQMQAAGSGGDETLSRLGTSPESAGRLSRKAAAAEAGIGIHGVSVSASTPAGEASTASRSAVEQSFTVHDTPSNRDPLHRTVELPKPITKEIADLFNKLFGRDK